MHRRSKVAARWIANGVDWQVPMRLGLVLALALGHVLALGGSAAHAMSTVLVNSTGDAGDLIPGDDVCHTGLVNSDLAPECTLRAAIEEANASAMIDQIHFTIPTADPGFMGGFYVIQPGAVLPWVSQPTTIDGTTQSGFGGTPLVVLDGSSAPPSPGGTDGLLVTADNSTIRGLVIRDYLDDGIELHGDGNTIVGNHLFNNDTGVLIENADDNVVGGSSSGDRNVISDNANNGIVIDGSDRAIIRGNYIGADTSGSAALGNQGHGIQVVGGSEDVSLGPNNVISGNSDHGIDLAFGAGVVTIHNNRIGTNASGTSAVGNGDDGVRADADAVVIIDNQVSGNGTDGLRIERLGAVVRGNLIGTDAVGTGPIPNGDDGIDTGSGTLGTTIGGTGAGEGNTIAFNGDNGIVLRTHAGTTASILGNSIFANTGLGIDLADDGPTPNDPGDGDPGPPNGLLNYPTISGAGEVGGTVYVDFDLDVPIGTYRVEFFTNPSGADPTGHGEGESFAGSVEVAHTTTGADSYTFTYPGATGVALSATATTCVSAACDDFTATSEFSQVSTVVAGNHAPELEFIGDKTTDELSLVAFDADASDPDSGDTLTFTLTNGPTGAAIDPSTGGFTWTPSEAQGPGSYTFDIVVTDDGTPSLSDSETITITVDETNHAPSLDAIGDQTIDEQSLLSFTATATDSDIPPNSLTFSLSDEPTGASIDPSGDFTWTPTEPQGPGSYTFDVIVTDVGTPNLSDSETITVTVNEVNQAPVVGTPPDQSDAEGDTVTVAVVASDPDVPANSMSYSATGLPAGLTIDPGTGAISGVIGYSASSGSPHSVTVTVADDGSPIRQSQVSFTWTVADTNRPPVLDPVGNQTVNEQTPLTFVATASDPDIDDVLTFSLSGAPGGAVIDPNTGDFTWTPNEAQGPGSYTFDVIVNDNETPNLSDSETISVLVHESNRPPVVSGPGNQHHSEGELVGVAVVASDPDAPTNTLSYGASGLPVGLTVDATSGLITGTIDYSASAGSPHWVSVVVTDNGAPTKQTIHNFTWTVDDINRPPAFDPVTHKVADEESQLQFTIAADDPDVGDVLSFSLSGQPAGASIDPLTGAFTWTPTEAQGPGTFSFSVIVTDDGVPALTDSQNVSVTVTEVNRPPIAVDDFFSTPEDTPVTADVLANDSDPDFPSSLSATTVGTSASGTTALVGSSHVAFTPIDDFTGFTTFDYEISDGSISRKATVTVHVTPLNDAPEARDDRYRLTTFDHVWLDVTRNDEDVDDDSIVVTLGRPPTVGDVDTDGEGVTYTPRSGWVGTVTFTYVVTDPSGATSEATVTLLIDDDVLLGAQRLADSLGVASIPFESPNPNFGAAAQDKLISMEGITLLADVFFQTVDALRIPLSFLGLTMLVVVGYGSVTRVPALLFGVNRRHWSVVLLGQQQRLPAYSEPAERRAIYNYEPTAAGIVSTGKLKRIGNTEWLPIDTPNGEGWLYREYLTEQVDLEAFMSDQRPVKLVHEFVTRLRDGKDVTPLLSKRGLVIALTGLPTQIPREHLAEFLDGSRLRHLRLTSAVPAEDFMVAVAEPFIEAYDVTQDISADTPHSKTALIPAECWNFPYLALGGESGVQPWLVFFEYRNGKAWIAGLGIDE